MSLSREDSSQAAWRGAGQIAFATLLFAIWHSLVASRRAKRAAARLLGERRGRGLYRLFFNLQSIPTTAALGYLVLTRPHRTVYQVPHPWRVFGWLGQACCAAVALWSVLSIGPGRFSGMEGLKSLHDTEEAPPAPEAQGSDVDEPSGEVRATGPFRWSRHPVEWAALGILWLSPTMRTNWLTFDLLSSLYMMLGAFHGEALLSDKAPDSYSRYQREVAFFLGRKSK